LQSVTRPVKIVGVAGKYAAFGAEIVEDRWPGEGPLGGIITALEDADRSATRPEWNLIVSCDLPFLKKDWLQFLANRGVKSNAQVVFSHSAAGPEPLCACWQTGGATKLSSGFERGVRKVAEGIALLRVEVIDEAVWKRFDSAGRLFLYVITAAHAEVSEAGLGADFHRWAERHRF